VIGSNNSARLIARYQPPAPACCWQWLDRPNYEESPMRNRKTPSVARQLFLPLLLSVGSTETQQPPLRQGARVRFIYDRDHVEIVENCELIAGPVSHWQVVTTWNGNRRVADAKEFVIQKFGITLNKSGK
jgi:hypothetical protein